jgi:RNA polymerase sigma-70 factor (ECF subfamily)
LQSERHFIARAANDPKIFGQLYDLYYPKIFGYIFRITGDYNIACDITSEAFLKAWIKIGSFKWRGISISSWFFKIATNELNQYFRRKKYTPFILIDLSVFDNRSASPADRTQLSDQGNDIITGLDREDEFRNIHRKLKMLPPKYQKVIALRFFEELSIREIGEILGKKEGTIKSLLSRGLDRLRNIF